MRPLAIISDVHSNLEALGSVLKDIARRKIEKIVFTGDAVGYGPDPDECIKLIRKVSSVSLMGNHDMAVIEPGHLDYFNQFARKAAIWTKDNISPTSLRSLKAFKMTGQLKKDSIFLVHSTPRDPSAWNYLYNMDDVDTNFYYFSHRICMVGHSHIPFIAEQLPSGEIVLHKSSVKINSDNRYIVNVGSVGQPRDGDPRSCYTIIKNNTIQIIRVKYKIEKTQEKMLQADLPSPLIERLSRGV
ncbi:MAG: metallophosphoesterase family protein [Nitrospirota bacterium]|nr:MAG: metallophosphoesterase family protein [Nitrospirota bacterium]